MPTNTQHLDPGKMNRRVAIQAPVDTPDGAGGATRSWKTIFTLWAKIEPMSGSEPYFATQFYEHTMYTILIRWRNGIVPGYRLLWGTHSMRIRSMLDPMIEHALVRMVCEELQAKGVLTP